MRASYWFVPSLLAAGAIVLSFVTVALDRWIGEAWQERIDAFDWLHGNDPDGARLLLSTIAGSMIGVAGVSFSVTIAALAYASNQFGPRIIHNFMRDRVNQITLGVFAATFLYCLLVLRTVTSEPGGAGVPHLSILVGIAFAVVCIGVLIHFIHNIADSIHANSAMARIGGELREAVGRLFPETIGDPAPPDPAVPGMLDENRETGLPVAFARHAVPVPATRDGYLQALSEDDLLAVAQRHDLVVRVVLRPGDFAVTGRPLAYAWPPDRVDQDVFDAIQRCYATGPRRTQQQDARLPMDQLVDMAGRALSPGVNDPMTAIGCLQWLCAVLSYAARRAEPEPARVDAEGTLRVVACPLTFDDLVEASVGRLRPYFETDRNAALAMMRMIAEVLRDTTRSRDRATLIAQAEKLFEGASRSLVVRDDVARLDRMLNDIKALAALEPGQLCLADSPEWMREQAL